MKWLLIIAGVVVALVVVVWIIGALLPRHHTASRTARFKQKPDTIFAAITDWRSFPQWRKELKEVRPRDGADGRESWIELSKFGELPMEIIESDPPRRLVGRIADPEHKLPFGGTWTYTITPDGDGDGDGDGCTLTITEDGEVRPAFFRFMARFIFGHAGTMEQYLKSLGQQFGEEVRPSGNR